MIHHGSLSSHSLVLRGLVKPFQNPTKLPVFAFSTLISSSLPQALHVLLAAYSVSCSSPPSEHHSAVCCTKLSMFFLQRSRSRVPVRCQSISRLFVVLMSWPEVRLPSQRCEALLTGPFVPANLFLDSSTLRTRRYTRTLLYSSLIIPSGRRRASIVLTSGRYDDVAKGGHCDSIRLLSYYVV